MYAPFIRLYNRRGRGREGRNTKGAAGGVTGFEGAGVISRYRGAADVSELITKRAQQVTRNIISKAFVIASRPTFQCASPTTIIIIEKYLYPPHHSPFSRSPTGQNRMAENVQPWDDSQTLYQVQTRPCPYGGK